MRLGDIECLNFCENLRIRQFNHNTIVKIVFLLIVTTETSVFGFLKKEQNVKANR